MEALISKSYNTTVRYNVTDNLPPRTKIKKISFLQKASIRWSFKSFNLSSEFTMKPAVNAHVMY